MLSSDQLVVFLMASVAVTASPGPDNLMVLSMGMAKGRARGLAFGLGCATGCLNHTLMAVLGVGSLVAASPSAFTALKVLGGTYLMWLGLRAWRSAGRSALSPDLARGVESDGVVRLFARGLLANTINPKVVLFFWSFLPQFVDASQGHVAMQLGLLGLVFTVQAALLFGALALGAGAIGQWLHHQPRAAFWLDRMAGGVFIALGVRLMFSR